LLTACSARDKRNRSLHLRLPGRGNVARGGARTKQRIIANLGAQGSRVVARRRSRPSGAPRSARLAQRSMVLSVVEGEAPAQCNVSADRGRRCCSSGLWQEVGCRAVIRRAGPPNGKFEFCGPRRANLPDGCSTGLFVSGLGPGPRKKWRAELPYRGALRPFQLHHPLPRHGLASVKPLTDQADAQRGWHPRCRKGRRGKRSCSPARRDLFCRAQRRLLWTPPGLSFEGQGGEELGRRGHSKDYRPDSHQMIVGLVMDQDGRPLCSELWPGNTADVDHPCCRWSDRFARGAFFGVGTHLRLSPTAGMISARDHCCPGGTQARIHPSGGGVSAASAEVCASNRH